MNSRLLNWFIIVSIGLYISVPILSVVSFLSSPFTGIRFYSCENDMQFGGVSRTCIRTVDKGSPADLAGIKPGDIVIDINGLGFPSYAYIHDPDYIGSDNLPFFWDAQKMLSDDGRGFNTGCDTSSSSALSGNTDRVKSGNGSGYGLKNIQKRMEELNGSFEIASTPSRGTLLTLSIPV